jgi:hypothetical protein
MAYRSFISLQRNQIIVPYPHLTKRLTTKILSRSPGIRKLASQTLTSNFKNLSLTNTNSTSSTLLIFSQRRDFADKGVVPIVETIDTVQRDLVRIITHELREIQTDDFEPGEYLTKTKFQLVEKDNTVHLSKIQKSDNSTVDVTFKIPTGEEDEDEQLNADAFRKSLEEEEEKDPEKEDKEKDEEEMDEDASQIDKLKDFNVVVTRQNPKAQLYADCAIGNDRRLYIEAIRFGDQSKKLFFEDLSDELCTKFYDYFDHLGIDDSTCAFILNYCEMNKLKIVTENLEHLKSFLEKKKPQQSK